MKNLVPVGSDLQATRLMGLASNLSRPAFLKPEDWGQFGHHQDDECPAALRTDALIGACMVQHPLGNSFPEVPTPYIIYAMCTFPSPPPPPPPPPPTPQVERLLTERVYLHNCASDAIGQYPAPPSQTSWSILTLEGPVLGGQWPPQCWLALILCLCPLKCALAGQESHVTP